jgi:hypothetical protein
MLHWRERDVFDPQTEVHYYLRIRMADNQNVWTGPVYVTYDPSNPTAVGDSPRARDLSLSASPNPAAGGVTARFVLRRSEARATLAVYDPSGRLVRTLLDQTAEAGEHRITWDGLSEDARPARAGLFFLRLETSSGSVSHKIVLLK